MIHGGKIPSLEETLSSFTNLRFNIDIKVIEFALNKDFASFKNNLKDNCSGDYIFQIDSDEYPEEYPNGLNETAASRQKLKHSSISKTRGARS